MKNALKFINSAKLCVFIYYKKKGFNFSKMSIELSLLDLPPETLDYVIEFLDLKSPGNKVWGPMRTVDVQRLPNTGLGISIVGGKVSLNFKSVKKAQDLNYALKFSPHIKQKGMY